MVLDVLVKMNEKIDPSPVVQAVMPRRGLRLLAMNLDGNEWFGLTPMDSLRRNKPHHSAATYADPEGSHP